MRHDLDRICGLVEMRRPETVGESMQFLQAANWIRLSLPNMGEVVSPLTEGIFGAEAKGHHSH